MRTRLYLEGINLDLYEDIDTTFTYVIDDVKEFGTRNTSFSKTITIPGNAVNNKAFGHIFNLGSANDYTNQEPNIGYNFNASVSARCVVFIDQVQVFKGSLRLIEIIDTAGELEYQCFVFGELGGLFYQIGNKRLTDLNFSEYDLNYSYANIISSWDNINGSGVYFPLTDYGNVSTNKEDFQYTAFRPALFVREYLEKIFSQTDYTIESNFLLSSVFDNLVIPHNQKELTKYSSNFFQGAPAFTTYNSTGNQIQLTFTASALGSFTLQSSNTAIRNDGSTITTNLVFIVTGLWSQGGSATFNLRKNGAIIASTFLGSAFSGRFFSSTITAANESIATNDVITLTLDWSTSQPYNLQVSAGSINFQSSTPTRVRVNLGDEIIINDTIPQGIFQKDFVLSIIKMFNLYVYESSFDEKKLIITPYVNFYSNEQPLNWTDKIDRSSPIKQIPMSELNARYYQYKFREDNDFYNEDYRKAFNEGYGDRIYDTEFEFSNETDELQLIFAASVLYQNVGTDKIYPAIYKLSGTTETPMDHVMRIGRAKKIICNQYDILDTITVLGSPTAYGYVGHLDDPNNPTSDINFGAPEVLQFTPTGQYPAANLFNSFHSGYISEITDKDSKLVVAYAYLNTVDIMNLNFSKLIYVDGVLFRLNKINEYNPTDLGTTQIQLLKVINLI